MRDHLTLHSIQKTACSKEGYGYTFLNKHESPSNITLRHKLK